jgi:DMSO/TMAO reductase YedYZ molybdopterin-dependent catalytic subunit
VPDGKPMISRARRALAGVTAGAAGLGTAELLAGLLPGAPSPLIAVGNLVIALQPPGAKQFMVDLVGEADKLILNLFIVVVATGITGGLGLLAPHRPRLVAAGFGALSLFVALASRLDPLVEPVLAVLAAICALAVSLSVLHLLLRRGSHASAPVATMPDWGRRRFIGTSIGIVGTAALAGSFGRYLLERGPGAPGISAVPDPQRPAPPLPAGAALDAPGITPIVTPNDRFYRIDTALLTPRLNAESWRLKVTGMVRSPFELDYDELLAMPLHEQYVTIACVSNEVGGDLVGNARWSGVRLRDLLDRAGVEPAATQIVGRAFDGWTAGFPTAWVSGPEREALVAVSMNGEPLPAAHGFPARLIVPGLYGYVSATKWLTEIELTTLEGFDAYWVPLGWAKEAPILTQSRIDVPRHRAQVAAGEVIVAGVAWAPDRGVARVEVSINGNAWTDAELSTPISDATWLQWIYRWNAQRGPNQIQVRATDGSGEIQTARQTQPAPDGARGHHTIDVNVV